MDMYFHQAIETRYIPASSTKPARVKAIAHAGTVMMSWDHELNAEANHARVAMALVRKYGWIPEKGKFPATWAAGALPSNRSGYVFVGGGDAVSWDFDGSKEVL